MQRSALALDVLTIIQSCLGERCRHYRLGHSRGIAPAVCPSITTSFVDRSETSFSDPGCDSPNPEYCADVTTETVGMRITITDVCMGPDAAEDFDFDAETQVAACFDDDVQTIEDCIRCRPVLELWQQLYTDHALTSVAYEGTTYDVESEGGGFSAYIELTFEAVACCPDPSADA